MLVFAVPIDVSRYRHIVVLTGAGISVASGLRPYRGPGGVWTDGGDPALATREGFEGDPEACWSLFGALRRHAHEAEPNAAHRVLARLESHCPNVTVVTQNVDGLHQRAGSLSVIEAHGSVFRTRCTNDACESRVFEDTQYGGGIPQCDRCGGVLRPDVVFFGEAMPVDEERAIKRALRDVELFVAVGTSGTVSPAANYVRSAAYNQARTVYVNLEPMEPPNPYFQESHFGPAEQILPELLQP